MSLSYQYDASTRTVEVRCSGELTLDEILAYFEALKVDETVEPGGVELVDLSEVTYFNVDFEQAARMPEGYVPAHRAKRIRATLLFGASEVNRGIAELIRALFQRAMPEHPFEALATRAQAEARRAELSRDE